MVTFPAELKGTDGGMGSSGGIGGVGGSMGVGIAGGRTRAHVRGSSQTCRPSVVKLGGGNIGVMKTNKNDMFDTELGKQSQSNLNEVFQFGELNKTKPSKKNLIIKDGKVGKIKRYDDYSSDESATETVHEYKIKIHGNVKATDDGSEEFDIKKPRENFNETNQEIQQNEMSAAKGGYQTSDAIGLLASQNVKNTAINENDVLIDSPGLI